MFLIDSFPIHTEPGIVVVTGSDAAAFQHFHARHQRLTAQLELVSPPPVEVVQMVVSPDR